MMTDDDTLTVDGFDRVAVGSLIINTASQGAVQHRVTDIAAGPNGLWVTVQPGHHTKVCWRVFYPWHAVQRLVPLQAQTPDVDNPEASMDEPF